VIVIRDLEVEVKRELDFLKKIIIIKEKRRRKNES
jgi:hypothetical protein